VCKAALIESVAVLRFNFRGVGRSGGKFDAGIGEQLDLEAALDFVARQPHIDSTKLMVAGYSFGGAVALSVAVKHELVQGTILISPGIDEKGWQQFKNYRKPKFVMLGENDTAVPYRGYERFFGDNTEYIIISGADHSWWGFEDEVERQTIKFFVNNASLGK